MSRTIRCPYCNLPLAVENDDAAILCMACHKSFFPAAAAVVSNPVFSRPKRPATGLLAAGIIFNILVLLGAVIPGLLLYSYYVTIYDDVRFLAAVFAFMANCIPAALAIIACIFNLILFSQYWTMLPSQTTRQTSGLTATVCVLLPVINLVGIWIFFLKMGNEFSKLTGLKAPKICSAMAAALNFLSNISVFVIFVLPLFTQADNLLPVWSLVFVVFVLSSIGYLIGLGGWHKAAERLAPQ